MKRLYLVFLAVVGVSVLWMGLVFRLRNPSEPREIMFAASNKLRQQQQPVTALNGTCDLTLDDTFLQSSLDDKLNSVMQSLQQVLESDNKISDTQIGAVKNVLVEALGAVDKSSSSDDEEDKHAEELKALKAEVAKLKTQLVASPVVNVEASAGCDDELAKLGVKIEHPVRDEFKKAAIRYIKLHKQMMAGTIPAKFVVFKPTGQLCNRIRGAVSAFTLAFLTDRAFVMREFGYGTAGYGDLFQHPGFDITGGAPGGSSTAVDMTENLGSADWFACKNFDEVSETVLELNGANYVNTYLYANPHLQKKLRQLFLDDDLYRPIVHWIFKPVEKILKMKDDFIRENMADKPYRVGFHFRTEYPITDAEWKAYRDCASAVTPGPFKNNAYWFASTDTLPARDTIRQQLDKDVIFYSPDKFIVGAYKEGLEQALVDILIAADVDILFLTAHSSFSRMISVYATTPHVYLVSDYGIPEQDPHRTFTPIQEHCYRYLSKEECAWHGHLTSAQEQLSKVSCYHPGMKSDYC